MLKVTISFGLSWGCTPCSNSFCYENKLSSGTICKFKIKPKVTVSICVRLRLHTLLFRVGK